MQKRRGTGSGGGFYTSVNGAAIAVATQCSIEEEVGTVRKERRRRTWAATEDEVQKNASLESGGGDDKSISDKRQKRGDKRFWSIPCRSDCYGGFGGGFGV